MTDASFSERIDQLREQVGQGVIQGYVNVDQVYAHYQDSGVGPRGKPAEAFDHPRGGEAGYLTDSLTAMGPDFAQEIADSISEETPMTEVFIGGVTDLILDVNTLAPLEWGNLRESAAAQVTDNGDVVYDRPALVPRLSDDELKALKAHTGWLNDGSAT